MIKLDLHQVVFSRKETNFAINFWDRDVKPGLWLRRIYQGIEALYRLEVIDSGGPVPFEVDCDPARLRLVAERGSVEVCIAGSDTIRVRGNGVGLRLERDPNGYGGLVEAPDGCWRSILGGTKLMFIRRSGRLEVEAPWYPQPMWGTIHHRASRAIIDVRPDDSGAFELMIEQYSSEFDPREYTTSFEEDVAASAADYAKWLDAAPEAPEELQAARDLAVYVNWSNVVPAAGCFPWPTMLMSKIGMTNCWNWDNYFNAWAGTYYDPEFAWTQYMLHIYHQHPQGAFGDGINEGSVGFAYTKPPVHGWILKRMLEADRGIGIEHLKEAYEPLCRWTNWWLTYRDDDDDGVYQYNHGNDSGWDNATIFDLEMPVESPDLNALLVKQMDCLAEFAQMLGKAEEAKEWKQKADALLERLVEHFWEGGRFVAKRSGTHEQPASGDCLLPHLAIVAGSRLPAVQRNATIGALKEEGRFLTAHGLATESVASDLHLDAGYWRGPIWAPEMMFAIDGINDAGDAEFARDLAWRFCRMCAKSGFAENFEATEGASRCDPAYTWTSSIFLILLENYIG
ncbi:MAG: amylo-alpha-1,6-glucosidase [Spirochaetales bacterium]